MKKQLYSLLPSLYGGFAVLLLGGGAAALLLGSLDLVRAVSFHWGYFLLLLVFLLALLSPPTLLLSLRCVFTARRHAQFTHSLAQLKRARIALILTLVSHIPLCGLYIFILLTNAF